MSIKIKKTKYILLICYFCAFFIYICQIRKNGMLYLSTDELGQWSTAAWMAGRDWSPISERNLYYSYFYSLPLSILFRVFHSPIFMYRAAVVMNALLLSGSVFIAYSICNKLCQKKDSLFYLIALNCALFSSNIVMVNLTWSESFLLIISWLVFYMSLSLFQKKAPSSYKIVFFAVLLMMGYMTHQRFLGILISGLLTVGIAFMWEKISKKQLLLFWGVIVILLIFHVYMKHCVQVNVYDIRPGEKVGNDYSGQIGKVPYLFSTEGILFFFRSVIGQLYYIGISTGFLGYFGIAYLVKGFMSTIKANRAGTEDCLLFLFWGLSVLLTVAISVIFLIHPGRTDQVIYGRYNEIVLGILLLLGWLELKEHASIQLIVAVILGAGFFSLVTRNTINILGLSEEVQYVCISGVAALWHKGLRIIEMYGLSVCLLIILFILIRKGNNRGSKVAVLMLTVFFVVSGLYVNCKIVLPIKQNWQGLDVLISETIKTGKEDKRWVWMNDRTVLPEDQSLANNVYPSLIQFLLKDQTLYFMDEESWENEISKRDLVVTNVAPLYLKGAVIDGRKGDVYLLEKNPEEREAPKEVPLNWFSSQGNIQDEYRSFGREEVLLFGPYIKLRAGNYVLQMEAELFEGTGDLGVIDAVAADQVFYKQIINVSEFTNGFCTINVPITLEVPCSNFEFRVMTNEGTDLQVKRVSLNYE